MKKIMKILIIILRYSSLRREIFQDTSLKLGNHYSKVRYIRESVISSSVYKMNEGKIIQKKFKVAMEENCLNFPFVIITTKEELFRAKKKE